MASIRGDPDQTQRTVSITAPKAAGASSFSQSHKGRGVAGKDAAHAASLKPQA